MADTNPYEILQVPPDADEDTIEEAYDRLFDHYEPKALAGDRRAIAVLEQLNMARDVLVDPVQRAALDARISMGRPAGGPAGPASAPAAHAAPRTPGALRAPAPAPVDSAGAVTGAPPATTVRLRRRSKARPRAVTPRPEPRIMLYALLGVLAVVVAGGLIFIVGQRAATGTRPPASASRGEVLATVNGVPIYSQDWEERLARDKEAALSDPFMAAFLDNFQSITGTRALEVIKSDALDKLINLEVIQQQARKEGLYPTEDQQRLVIEDAKQREVPAGQTFEEFLKHYNITEEQYNRRVVENLVYALMANEHMPKTGTNEEKTNGFIKWICDTRKNYDVKVFVTFNVDNPPCTSGLPTDLPLPGVEEPTPVPDQEQLPLPVETVAPTTPRP